MTTAYAVFFVYKVINKSSFKYIISRKNIRKGIKKWGATTLNMRVITVR
jgi:hypothetical protein